MISTYKLKPAFQKLLEPVVIKLYNWGITANQITIAAILFSFILGALFFYRESNSLYLIVVAFGLLLRMGLNALDGMMARKFNMQSKLGEVLNELGDIVSDVAILLPFMSIPFMNKYLFSVFLVMVVVNEACHSFGT